jgi:hypothetical protein
MGINKASLGSVSETSWMYTVTFTNVTTDVIERVVLFFTSTAFEGVKYLEAVGLAPNRSYVFKLDQCADMIEYNIGVFIDDELVARIPESGSLNSITASALNPTDHFLCEDSWRLVSS